MPPVRIHPALEHKPAAQIDAWEKRKGKRGEMGGIIRGLSHLCRRAETRKRDK